MRVLIYGLTENSYIRGVEKYIIETCRALSETSKTIEITLLHGAWQKYYCELIGIENISLKEVNITNKKIIRHLHAAFYVPFMGMNYDVIHYMNTLPVAYKFTPILMTVHDLAEYHTPEKYSLFQAMYRKKVAYISSRVSDKIITVSNYSKQDIVARLGLDANRVEVTYNGVCNDKKEKKNAVAKSYDASYLLYVGNIERSKGVLQSLQAFAELKDEGRIDKSIKFYLAGSKGNALSDIKGYINREDVCHLGYVSEEDLTCLYANALAFVFVSQHEGFGLPAIEAFQLNDNVVSSCNSSLGEVTKEFAIQVDPFSLESIKAGICEAVSSPKSYAVEEKDNILKDFDWIKSAEILIGVYNNVVYD